jgi:ribonuclease HI
MIEIFTDGSCYPNPGQGGWGVIIIRGDTEYELYGADQNTTSERMELTAVAVALKHVGYTTSRVVVYCDSKNVTEGIKTWNKHKQQTASNVDLWQSIYDMYTMIRCEIIWIKGHNGNEYNERVDKLAKAARYGKI